MNTLDLPAMLAGSSSSVPTHGAPPPDCAVQHLQDLYDKIDLLTGVAEFWSMYPQEVLNIKSSLLDLVKLLEKHINTGHQLTESFVQFNVESMSEAEARETRYLYVSNGHEIYLLDLLEKPLSTNVDGGDHVPSLPIVASLDLIAKGCPVSVSLFKVGSEAYIIGGEKYNPDVTLHGYYDGVARKGTSRYSWRLSTCADDDDRGTLSLSLTKGFIRKMRRPKLSPIVEEIDGAIHVFDSTLWASIPSFNWRFTHEALCKTYYDFRRSRFGWRWREISADGGPVDDFIHHHVVVGPCIYAMSRRKAFLFDSSTKKWEVKETYYERQRPSIKDPVRHVMAWDITPVAGDARCVLELGGGGGGRGGGGGGGMMYAILVVDENGCRDSNTVAVAYLVNSAGRVVCMQPLNNFFEGSRMMKPSDLKSARIIKALDDQDGSGWCSLVNASTKAIRAGSYLFINMFTVTQVSSFDSSKFAFEITEPPSCLPIADFIRIVIKRRYIYKTEDRLHRSMQACFMASRHLGFGGATNC